MKRFRSVIIAFSHSGCWVNVGDIICTLYIVYLPSATYSAMLMRISKNSIPSFRHHLYVAYWERGVGERKHMQGIYNVLHIHTSTYHDIAIDIKLLPSAPPHSTYPYFEN